MKKYYKFIFMALFGLFIFLPKDTFAMGIRIYDETNNLIGTCSDCTEWNGSLTGVKSVQFRYNVNTISNNRYAVSYDFTLRGLSYSNNIGNVTVSSGQFQEWSSYNYMVKSSTSTNVMGYIERSTFNGSWTQNTTGGAVAVTFFFNNLTSLSDILVNSESLSDFGSDNSSTNETIISSTTSIIQNNNNNTQQIIQSNEEIKKEQEKTNEELGELNDNLTSEDAPDLDALEDSAGWLPPGPVDSILNLPLTFFNNLISNLSKTCQPVNIPLPYVSKNLTLPCISTLYEQIGATTFLNWVGLIVGTIILYNYFLNLYKWIDDTIQMKDNSVDDWGGV